MFPLNQTDIPGTFLMKWQNTWFQCAPQGDFTPLIRAAAWVCVICKSEKKECKRPSICHLAKKLCSQHSSLRTMTKPIKAAQLHSFSVTSTLGITQLRDSIHAMHLQSISHFSYAPAQLHRCLWLRLRLPNDNLDKLLYLTRSIKIAQTVRFHQEEFKGLVAPVVNTHPSDGNLHCGTVRLCKIKKRHPWPHPDTMTTIRQ